MFEDVAIGGIAATAITQQQDRRRLSIMRLPDRFPPGSNAVAGETAGVVADSQVDVTLVALDVVKAVRIDDTPCGAREVVVQSSDGVIGVGMSVAIEIADELLLLGID